MSTQEIIDAEQLGRIVRKYRKQKGITQQEVAVFADVSRLAVSEVETGKTDVRLSTLLKILRACSLSITIQER